MNQGPVAVQAWPERIDTAQDLLLVAIDTPTTHLREAARNRVRGVLQELLEGVELISAPGQAIRVADTNSTIGISVSHESGLSLLAIKRSGPIGIDLLRMDEDSLAPTEVLIMASDYLGPETARRLAELPPSARSLAFATAWTEHEACLKLLGLGLNEWSAELAKKLQACQTRRVALPPGFVGAVATLRADENPSA